MSSKKRLLAVALAGVLLLSSVAAVGVARSATANDSLSVAVENVGNDGATVTVTQNDSAVENASVTVEVEDNGTYAGADTYTTDENGTVSLPEPEKNVTVEVTAAKDNETATTSATLIASESEDDEPQSFGQMVSSFVDQMLNGNDDGGPLGQTISDWVTSNNPGADKKSDHAGKPDDVGAQNNSTAENGSQGPPENAGNGNEENERNRNGNGHGNDQGNDRGDDSAEETTTTTESEE